MGERLVGSWQLVGMTNALDTEARLQADAVWVPTLCSRRLGKRVGYVFRADGTGQLESRTVPPVGPPQVFRWRVEGEGGLFWLVFGETKPAVYRFPIWVRADNRRFLMHAPGSVGVATIWTRDAETEPGTPDG